MTVGDTVGAVGTIGLETVDAFGSRGSLESSLLGQDILIGVLSVIVDDHLGGGAVKVVLLILDRVTVKGVTGVGRVNEGLETETLAREVLDDLLVLPQGLGEVLVADVVKEDTGSERRGDRSTKHTISGLEDSFGALGKDLLVEILVVNGQTNAGEEVEDTHVLLVAQQTTLIGKGC